MSNDSKEWLLTQELWESKPIYLLEMTVRQLLGDTRDFLSSHGRFTNQTGFALDQNGKEVDVLSNEAKRFSLTGALFRVWQKKQYAGPRYLEVEVFGAFVRCLALDELGRVCKEYYDTQRPYAVTSFSRENALDAYETAKKECSGWEFRDNKDGKKFAEWFLNELPKDKESIKRLLKRDLYLRTHDPRTVCSWDLEHGTRIFYREKWMPE